MKQLLILCLIATLAACSSTISKKGTKELIGYWEYLDYQTEMWYSFHFEENESYRAVVRNGDNTVAYSGNWVIDKKTLILSVNGSQDGLFIPIDNDIQYNLIGMNSEYMVFYQNEHEQQHFLQPISDNDTAAITDAFEYWELIESLEDVRQSAEATVSTFFTALSNNDFQLAKLLCTETTAMVLEHLEGRNETSNFEVKAVECDGDEDFVYCDLCCNEYGKEKTGVRVIKIPEKGWAVEMSKEEFSNKEDLPDLSDMLLEPIDSL